MTLEGVKFYVNQDTVLMEGWAQDKWDAKTLQVFLVEEDKEYTYFLADKHAMIHSEKNSLIMSQWIDKYCASHGYTRQPDTFL